MSNNLTALVYGDSKQGKSWLITTTPGPRLVIETEGRAGLIPGEKVMWDPRTQWPTTLEDGSPITTETTVIVTVRDFPTFKLVYSWLAQGGHYFRSIIIDSFSELQQRFIDLQAPGAVQLETGDWGAALRELTKVVRDYRDLRTHPTNPIDCLLFTAGEVISKSGKLKPMLQGQIVDRLSYFFDLVAYLHHVPDASGGFVRILSIDGTNPLYISGSNWDVINDTFPTGQIVVPHKTEGRKLLTELWQVIQ